MDADDLVRMEVEYQSQGKPVVQESVENAGELLKIIRGGDYGMEPFESQRKLQWV